MGYSKFANNTTPFESTELNYFNFQGGTWSLYNGISNDPLEFGIDFSHFYGTEDIGKVYFIIKEFDLENSSSGTINYYSLIDHRWDEVFELNCSQNNVPIVNNGNTTLSIEYHLLPHHDEQITQNLTLASNRVSRFTPIVTNGAKLTVGNGVNIDMYNSEIHIKPGATLQLNSNSKIIARRGQCKIVVDGDITISPGVQFIAEGDASLEVFLNNNGATIAIQNATFQQCKVHSQVASLSIGTSSFINCKSFYSYYGDLNLFYNTYTNTSLHLENKSKNQNIEAKITNCSIVNTLPNATGIKLVNYSKYLISGNTVQGFCNGIDLFASGSGPAGNKSIIQNNIHDCSWAGILAYNTSGIIETNSIFNNGVGIKLMNNCNMAVIGNPDAQTLSQTQQIRDNESYEVYISQFSFPYLFQYNSIIDEDNIGNPTDPMFLFSNAGIIYPQFPKWYVENNCWGSNFEPEDDLKVTYGTFKVYPIWCPGGTKSINDPIEEMYAVALEKIKNGYYNDARNILQYLIQNYPRSIQGQAAMKDLLVIEEYNGTDFAGLKNYFLTNDSIVSDSLLKKLGDYLSNQCDIKLENWSQAINWYENRILNPSCLEDSIFSIIDLGSVYFLIENEGLKSAYCGNLKQFIPETKSKYFENKDYLLSLLPGEMMSDKLRFEISNLSNGCLLQNVPNPFTGSTQIWYKVEKKANVSISISDLSGKEIMKIEQGNKGEGTYKADFINFQLASGTYFYTLLLDGKRSDTKKLIKI